MQFYRLGGFARSQPFLIFLLYARWKLLREKNRFPFLFCNRVGTSSRCHTLALLGFWGRDEISAIVDKEECSRFSCFERAVSLFFFFFFACKFSRFSPREQTRFDGIFPSNLIFELALTTYLLFRRFFRTIFIAREILKSRSSKIRNDISFRPLSILSR